MHAHVLILVLSLALTLFASTAGAQEPSPAEAEAETLIHDGVELRKNGKEGDALDRFRRAYAIHPSPRALAQIGLASKSMRLYIEAERALIDALAVTNDAWVNQNRAALELARDVVGKQLASLVVRSNVAEGAELFVNGALVATKLPLERPVRVLAGVVHVELRAPRYQAGQVDAKVPSGETMEIRVDLVKSTEESVPAAATTPTHAPAAALTPDTPASPSKTRRYALYGSLGLSAIGLGVGTVFGVKTFLDKSDRDRLCDERTCSSDAGFAADADARQAAQVSTIGFVVGVAALATAAVLFFTEPRRAAASSR